MCKVKGDREWRKVKSRRREREERERETGIGKQIRKRESNESWVKWK